MAGSNTGLDVEAIQRILRSGIDASGPDFREKRRLTGVEVAELVFQRVIIEDRSEIGGSPTPQGEHFRSESRVDIYLDRGVRARGVYGVFDDALCVTRSSGQSHCRAIFIDNETSYFQVFFGSNKLLPIRVVSGR